MVLFVEWLCVCDIWYYNCNCNCNLFAVHTSKIGYSPVDIDIVIYILSNVMYKYNENTIIEY